jgi:hypothetical protein
MNPTGMEPQLRIRARTAHSRCATQRCSSRP